MYALIAFECGQVLLPERGNSYGMTTSRKFEAEITHMPFFPTNKGGVELGEH
jgi:hypothetical protein